jgi:DNA polymerase-3 subunit alpha
MEIGHQMSGSAKRSSSGAKSPGFVNLHVHSAYSLLEGALPIKTLLSIASKDAQPALAITDTNNLFGALEFSLKATGDGIQPIIGCQVSLDMEDGGEQDQKNGREHLRVYPSIVLLASRKQGYENLVELVSKAYLQGDDADATHLKLSWLSGRQMVLSRYLVVFLARLICL